VPRIRIGVVGCGLIGQMMHLPHLKELPERFELLRVALALQHQRASSEPAGQGSSSRPQVRLPPHLSWSSGIS